MKTRIYLLKFIFISACLLFGTLNFAKNQSKDNLSPNSSFKKDNYSKLITQLKASDANRLADSIDPLLRYFKQISKEKIVSHLTPICQAALNSYHIKEVYGVGFPFYLNNTDSAENVIGKRMYNTISNALQQTNRKNFIYKEDALLKKLLPDYDLLLIYDASNQGPWSIDQNLDNKMAENFLKNSWRFFFQDFVKQIKEHNLTATKKIKLHLGDLEEDYFEKLVWPLFDKTKLWDDIIIHLDLLTVANHVWEAAPLLILDEDVKTYYFLRDIMFTSQQIVPMNSEVVSTFRKNFLLNALAKAKENIFDFNQTFKLILSKHPYKKLVEDHPEIFNFTYNLWLNTFNEMLRDGLIQKYDKTQIALTKKGNIYISHIHKKREELLDNGFDISDTIQTWTLQDMVQQAA